MEPALEGGGAQAARASSTRPPDAGKPSTGGSERDVSVTLDPNGPDDSKEPEPKPSPSPRPSSTPTCANQGGQGSANQQPNGQGAQGVQARQGGGAVQQGGGQGARAMTEAEAESAVSQATTDLAEAKEVLRGVTIKAPADGTVLSIAGTLDTNYTGGTFITLGDLDNLQVQALFPQSDIGYLKLGQTATITINSTDSYEGTVAHIDPTATTSGQLVRYGVTITFKDQPKGLLLGQSATVQVTTAESEDTLYIPARALHTSATGTTTVTTPSGEKTIKTGVRSDLYIEVTEGLTTTDQITLPATSATEFPDEGFPGL